MQTHSSHTPRYTHTAQTQPPGTLPAPDAKSLRGTAGPTPSRAALTPAQRPHQHTHGRGTGSRGTVHLRKPGRGMIHGGQTGGGESTNQQRQGGSSLNTHPDLKVPPRASLSTGVGPATDFPLDSPPYLHPAHPSGRAGEGQDTLTEAGWEVSETGGQVY